MFQYLLGRAHPFPGGLCWCPQFWGAALPQPLVPPAAAELSNGLVASSPWGTPPSPVPVSLSQSWERQPWRARRLDPPKPLCFWSHSWPLLLGHCGCSPQPRAARGGSDTRVLSQAPSLSCFCTKILGVLQCARLSAHLPSSPAWLRGLSPPCVTSIHGRQYS